MSKKTQKKQKQQSEQEQDLDQLAELFDKPVKQVNDGGQTFWSLGNNKRVTVSQFKNKTYVNIRQYYEKDGEFLPSKKGISLGKDQWQSFKKIIQDIDKNLIQTQGSKGSKKVKK